VIDTQSQIVRLDEPLHLECGRSLPFVDVAYETYGRLNERKTNAVLICHALSGDAHVAAGHGEDEGAAGDRGRPGWWDNYVGPGKAIDTDRYFVICSNVLGGCKGTTGPGSINPESGRIWGIDFPIVAIGDMVEVQRRLIDHLGIEKLLCVVGGSMGGMQALEWAVRFPGRLVGAIPIATTTSLSAQSLAFDAVGRNAIIFDPHFQQGRYDEHGVSPSRGLAIARMLGHITYLSEESMDRKFGRTLRYGEEVNYDFASQFNVETYLDHQGRKFVERFDANSYLYLTRAMDLWDVAGDHGGLAEAFKQTEARFLVVSFSSDWLFPAEQSQQIVKALLEAGRSVSYVNIPSPYGHDTFLLENDLQERALAGYLRRLSDEADPAIASREVVSLRGLDAVERRRLDLERISGFVEPNETVVDLGCGDGLFLAYLRSRGSGRVLGVDNDEHKVVAAIERGVDAIHDDLDEPLEMIGDQSFDVVLLSRTLQVVRHPATVLNEMLRIGRRCIVTFPNFGYWRNRHQIAWTGRVPVTRNLPFSWADSPNLHHLSMKDFESWCREHNVRIDHRIAMDFASENRIRWLPNLRATDALYVVSRR